jgi:hypothetical protein
MTQKIYTHDQVTYGYSLRMKKWKFTVKQHSFLFSVKGKEMADKISHLIQAGLVRSNGKGIDGLARSNINTVLSR